MPYLCLNGSIELISDLSIELGAPFIYEKELKELREKHKARTTCYLRGSAELWVSYVFKQFKQTYKNRYPLVCNVYSPLFVMYKARYFISHYRTKIAKKYDVSRTSIYNKLNQYGYRANRISTQIDLRPLWSTYIVFMIFIFVITVCKSLLSK